jgi:putative SOS response-associated peptidase YedK
MPRMWPVSCEAVLSVRRRHRLRLIPPDQYGLWLDPRCQDTDKLAKLLRPYPSKDMLAYRISTIVNNPRNDVPQCVEALK